jgi:hypothetical protein
MFSPLAPFEPGDRIFARGPIGIVRAVFCFIPVERAALASYRYDARGRLLL